MKAIIGTSNPGKIEGAKKALEVYFEDVEIESYKASSDVGEQPISEETVQGARNRALNTMKYAQENNIDADLFMGIESGIINLYDPKHISLLLCNYSQLKESTWDKLNGDMKWLLWDLDKIYYESGKGKGRKRW